MNYPAWQLKKADPAAETSLAGAGCGVLLRRVLAARGCTDPAAAQALLGQGEPLSDPFLLTDMDKAVVRIQEAIENEELMVIYGDYDVDGISATAILYECLTSQGAHVRCKLPTRGSGYGLTRAALESLASKGFKLVVTVDNGISAVEEAACAKELGLDLIITDHHLPGDTLPDAIAVVDPKRPDDESPFKDLCGAGVAFKLCAALEGCDPAELLEMYGELAALGTVADVMPLVGENRTIVREGLSLLQDTMRPGLHALLESAGCGGKPVTADTVSYSLAPRLNAAGRMDNAAVALKLLLCGDEDQATGIAERLAEIASKPNSRSLPLLCRRWRPTPPAPGTACSSSAARIGTPASSASWRHGSWSGSAARSSSSRCTRARAAAAGAHRTRSICTVRSQTAHSI